MLILTRKFGESLVIDGLDGPITVRVQRVGRGKVSLAIDAPRTVPVRRSEVVDGHTGRASVRRPIVAGRRD